MTANPDDPSSWFRSKDGLAVRVINAGVELSRQWHFRPVSILKPGSRFVVSCNNDFNEFERGRERVVTILKPGAQSNLLWAFKQDVTSEDNGEASRHKPGSAKKITSFDLLSEKMSEIQLRQGSVFPPFTSGHIGCDGYRLHKPAGPYREAESYPEVICQLNPHQMHWGYLLDFNREKSFRRVADVMTSILTLEKSNAAPAALINLCLYDSQRGVLLAQEKLERATVEDIAKNAETLSQYECSMGMVNRLFALLAQSGCERFLSLLKNLPDDLKALVEDGGAFDMDKLRYAIRSWDANKFRALLSAVDAALLSRVGLPESLLKILTSSHIISDEEYEGATNAGKFILQFIGEQRYQELVQCIFSSQAEICRELLNNRLFIPILGCCRQYSALNPLVTCLLIANGSRVSFGGKRFAVLQSLSPLFNAMKFFKANLLSCREVMIIRHEVLWEIICNADDGQVVKPKAIKRRLKLLVDNLYNHFKAHHIFYAEASRLIEPPRPSPPGFLNCAQAECRLIIGEEIYDDYYLNQNTSGWELKLHLESGLSTRRYNDEDLLNHLRYLQCLGLTSDYSRCALVTMRDKYYAIDSCYVIRALDKNSNDSDWLSTLLATPLNIDRTEFASLGRYRAITRAAGQHYYQNPHPARVRSILAQGVKPFYRRYHGLDHALRTQMGIEFLIEVLPHFHNGFKALLASYPQLPELLSIAELYHDAVAEDEPKDMEELRAAELFERDMQALHDYPHELITLVASALRNKNSNEMPLVQLPFTRDDQCPAEECLLRQVLRFGDVVDIVRLVPLQENFLEETHRPFATASSVDRGPDKFHPEAIELLAAIDNPQFTRLVKSAVLTFRELASLTGGWHHESVNPVVARYHLLVDNHQRRLLIEQSPEPYRLIREVLDDLVRLTIAEKAGIDICLDGHQEYARNKAAQPDCWDKTTGVAGTYRKLHSEQELRQVRLPGEMTLGEKICFAAPVHRNDRVDLSPAASHGIHLEIARLQSEGIYPQTGTPSQAELKQIYQRPDCVGATVLSDQGMTVVTGEHEGRIYYRMA